MPLTRSRWVFGSGWLGEDAVLCQISVACPHRLAKNGNKTNHQSPITNPLHLPSPHNNNNPKILLTHFDLCRLLFSQKRNPPAAERNAFSVPLAARAPNFLLLSNICFQPIFAFKLKAFPPQTKNFHCCFRIFAFNQFLLSN